MKVDKTNTDLTAKLRQVENLQHQRDLLATIVNQSVDGIVVVDADGRVEFANPAAKSMFAGLAAELVGYHIGTPALDKATEITIPAGSETRQAELRAAEVQWEGRKAFLVSLRDVTEERKIQAANRELALLVENTDDAVIGVSLNGTIRTWNRGAELIYGYTAAEALDRNISELATQDIANNYDDLIEQIRQGRRIHHYRTEGCTKAGKRIALSLTMSPVHDKTGKISGLSIIAREMTNLLQLEAQLQQAQKMESIGRLAGGVAHDYNNMLSIIVGYADMALSRVKPDDPLHEDLEEILKAAERSTDITRQLLAFARKQPISPRILDLNQAVENMLKMLRRLIGDEINLAWKPGTKLWPVKVDPAQVNQLLTNLCINARDAIKGTGIITIETKNIVLDEYYSSGHQGFLPGEYAVLALSDTGSGMEKEVLDKIFEPFFTTKKYGQGTGLGMATVYGIVKQNNGFINVYSEPGTGTIIRIYLPRIAKEKVEAREERETATAACTAATVLVVEDHTHIMELCKKMLGSLGFTVLAASTPDQAIKTAEGHDGEIDLLLSDVVMPQMDCRELARRLQAVWPDLKVLFMSGYSFSMTSSMGLLDEKVNFLQKPFTKKSLAAKISEVLGQGK